MQLEGMGCFGMAEEDQDECGTATSGSSAQGGQGEGKGHGGTLPWHPDHDPAPSTCPQAGLSMP